MSSKRRRGDGPSGAGGDAASGGAPAAAGAGGGSPAASGSGGGSPAGAGSGRGSLAAAGAGRGSPTASGAGRGSPVAAGAGRGSPTAAGAGRGSPAAAGAGRGSPAGARAGRGSPAGVGRGSPAAQGSGGAKKYSVDPRVTRSASSGSKRQTRSGGSTPELALGSPKRGSSSKGKGKVKVKVKVKVEESSGEAAAGNVGGDHAGKTLVIEHYLKSPSKDFKKYAADFRKLLETAIPDARVLINPEKKVTGFFTIREEGGNGETFLSLSDMAKPFQELESLNKGTIVENIVKRLNDNNAQSDDESLSV